MLSAVLRIAAKAWQRHYHVPEWADWFALLAFGGGALVAILSGFYGDLFDGQLFDRKFVGGISVVGTNLIAMAVAAIGIARWHVDRRRARGGLVIPRFYEFAGAKGRGEDMRLAVLDALNQNLPEAERSQVHGIKAVVDLQHQAFAAQLLRRLRAYGVLHGRVVDRKDGGWTVHARLARPALTEITHYDWHTNDATPGRMRWQVWFSKLPSSFDVTDEEFPLELTRDLGALVRGAAGVVGLAESPGEMESLLADALAANPDSTIPAMDVLRTQLAFAVFLQEDRQDEALDLLRGRIQAGDAFGELLRGFAFLAGIRRRQIADELGLDDADEHLMPEELEDIPDDEDEGLTDEQRELLQRSEELERQAEDLVNRAFEEDEEDDEFEDYEAWERRLRNLDVSLREEILSALAMAADDKTDPRSDMSLYNLINALLSAADAAEHEENDRSAQLREEAWAKLEALRDCSDYYREAWYVKRLCGVRAWRRFEAISAQHRAHSPEGISAARDAGKWYARAIRARPKVVVVSLVGLPLWRRYRLRSRRSPILDANAFDAHSYAGHRVRARYYEIRFQHRRRRLLRGAYRDLRRGYLELGLAQLDWLEVGRHRPEVDRYDAVEAVAVAARDRVGALIRAAAERQAEDETTNE